MRQLIGGLWCVLLGVSFAVTLEAAAPKSGTSDSLSDDPLALVTQLDKAASDSPATLSANAYHDLGVAYARLGEKGAAMAAWAAALSLAPRDQGILRQWHSLGEQLGANEREAAERWRHHQFFLPLSLDEWWFLGVIGTSLSFCWGAFCLMRPSRAARMALLAFAVVALGLWGIFGFQRWRYYPLAAVVSHQAPFFAESRSDEELRLFVLPEASSFRIQERQGTWVKAETFDGRQGWVAARDYTVYDPL